MIARNTISRDRAGFTLIELLVVIGIILLLVALTLTVGTGMLRQSEVRETQNTLQILEIALSEWERGVDRQVLYGKSRVGASNNGEPCGPEQYELEQVVVWPNDLAVGDLQALQTTDNLWALLGRSTTVRELLARVNPDFLRELDPANPQGLDLAHLNGSLSYRILDSWGNPIIAVMPGRRHNRQCEGNDYTVDSRPDADGTIRTAFENRYGTATDRRVFFVSAGPSGVFGDLHLDIALPNLGPAQLDGVDDASDNLYSYPVFINQARPSP